MASGFNLVNCIWYNDKDSSNYIRIINTIDNPNQITTSGDYPITTANFSWHNATNTKPFEPALYNLEELTSLLVESQHVGANSNYDSMYIYTAAIYNTIK